MGNLELERTSYIGFVSGKILRNKFLQFLQFCGRKKFKKKNYLKIFDEKCFKHFLNEHFFLQSFQILHFFHKFSKKNILKNNFFSQFVRKISAINLL
jgi:hypothetical protein